MKSKLIPILRAIIYINLGKIDKILNRKNNLFILCYHSFSEDGWPFGVSLIQLEKQLKYLLKSYQPVSLEDISKVISGDKNLNSPSFAVTIDDGYQDVYEAKQLFKKLKIKPSIFLIAQTNLVDRSEIENNKSFLSDKQIVTLYNEGWQIGCHSYSHPDFFNLNHSQINQELIESKQILEKRLNIAINYFAYPKGRYTDQILDIIKKAGYSGGLSMNDSLINKQTEKFIIPRVGIICNHSFEEFKYSFSPSVVLFRSIVKKYGFKI